MLERLIVRNFQAHEKLRLDLDPLVTTIVGPSDVGKSSVVRALRWLATNRPAGNEFVRWGAEFASIHLTLDDGCKVRRQRGGSINAYGLDGREFAAFGQDVPPDIADALNLSDVNFQGQLDAPWWFMRSPGEVSRELNAIINLGLIDSTLANIAAEARKAKVTLGIVRERLDAAEAQRDALAWTVQASSELAAAEAKSAEQAETALACARLRSGVLRLGGAYEALDNAVATAKRGVETEAAGAAWLESKNRAERLRSAITGVEAAEEAAAAPLPSPGELERVKWLWEIADAAGNKRQRLASLILLADAAEDERCQAEESATSAESELDRQMKGRCPVCDRQMD